MAKRRRTRPGDLETLTLFVSTKSGRRYITSDELGAKEGMDALATLTRETWWRRVDGKSPA
jgi:hypothetical protein